MGSWVLRLQKLELDFGYIGSIINCLIRKLQFFIYTN